MKRPLIAAAVAVAACLCAGAAAAGYFLTPRETAQALGYDALADAFDAPDAITVNETQSDAGYDVTLLGLTQGQNLTGYWSSAWGELIPDRTYAAIAIRNSDGSPMPSADDPANTLCSDGLLVGPLIAGEDPAHCNPFMMNTAYAQTVTDGVLYRLVECDTVYPFADRTVYLMVQQGRFPDHAAFPYDEASGAISADPARDGLNVLFTLPLDPAQADPEQAAALLAQWCAPDRDEELPPEQQSAQEALASWTLARVRSEGTLVNRETVPLSDGSMGEGWYFSNGFAISTAAGFTEQEVLACIAEGQAGVLVYNDDGTATYEEYTLPTA